MENKDRIKFFITVDHFSKYTTCFQFDFLPLRQPLVSLNCIVGEFNDNLTTEISSQQRFY